MMPSSILWSITFVLLASGILLVIKRLYQIYEFPTESSRKIAHVTIGLTAILFINLVDDPLLICLICGIASILLFLTKWKRSLDFIHNIPRESLGSVIYPIPFMLCYLISRSENEILYLYPPLLTFVLADPAAAIVGQRRQRLSYRIYDQIKTLSGSMVFGIITFLITFCFSGLFPELGIVLRLGISLIIAATASFVEAVTPIGMDNLSVPLFMVLAIKLVLLSGS